MAQLGLADAPQEIIDEIIDRCSGEKRTLIACSLTSRTWVYRTRKHLFSKLTLTDKTLPVWCGIVVTPTTTGRKLPQPLPSSYPPPSSSYASSWLSSYVTSLQLVPKYSKNSKNNLGAQELLRARSHLSAFTNLKSLALTAISFAHFDDASLKACFGSLAETVSELKLWACSLGEEKFFAFLRLFPYLESLEVNGNMWSSSGSAEKTGTLEKGSPTLRGSFTASDFTYDNLGLLESLATAKVEYHTITLGWNPPSTFPKFNALFVKCKDHLKTLTLTALEQSGMSSSSAWDPPPQLDQANETLSRESAGSGSLPLRETCRGSSDVRPRRVWDYHSYSQDRHVTSFQEVDVLYCPSPTFGQDTTTLDGVGRGGHRAGETGRYDSHNRYAPSVVLLLQDGLCRT